MRKQVAEWSCVLMQDHLCCVVRNAACLDADLSELIPVLSVLLGFALISYSDLFECQKAHMLYVSG